MEAGGGGGGGGEGFENGDDEWESHDTDTHHLASTARIGMGLLCLTFL